MQSNYEILIVDNVNENIEVAEGILRSDDYTFTKALSSKEAMSVLKSKRFDLMILDVEMADIDGLHLCKIVKNSPAIADTPMIFVTSKVDIKSIEQAFKLGAVDYVTKPFHPIELQSRVASHLELYRHKKELKKINKILHSEMDAEKNKHITDLELAQKEIMYILTQIVHAEGEEITYHLRRVAIIAKKLAMLEGTLSDKEVDSVYLAAPLYDIGKILINSELLHKTDELSDEELNEIKQYPEHANNILKKSKSDLLSVVRIIAHQHHEKFDGTGYPQGISGENIHIFARIIAIADVLDSTTHDRAYGEAWPFEQAAKYIIDRRGSEFDPRLVTVFSDNLEIFKEIIEDEEYY